MQRVTIVLDDELISEIDRMAAARGYQNRSEVIRDLTREGLRQRPKPDDDSRRPCVAALVYVYDHAARQLPKRLTDAFHDHHDLSLASMHAHLDHETCMEVTILRGETGEVQHFAEHVIAERGVRHGRLIMVPSQPATAQAQRVSHRRIHGKMRKGKRPAAGE